MTSRVKGMALAFALAIFPLLLVLGMAFMALSGTDYGFTGRAALRVRAFYLADAGVRYAYYERARWRENTTFNLKLSTGDVRVQVDPLKDGKLRVTSTGRSASTTARVVAEIDYLGQISSWVETSGVWDPTWSTFP